MTNRIGKFFNAVLLAGTLLLAGGCGSGGSAMGTNAVTNESGGSTLPGGETVLGSVTLSWTAPTYNEDGSVLIDLDGYRIYWGKTPGQYENSVTVENESISVYVIESIPVGTYNFVATSLNSAGVESRYSNPVIGEVRQ